MENDFTIEQKDRYISTSGIYCPTCKGYNVVSEPASPDTDGIAYSKVHCIDCQDRWLDVYRLSDIVRRKYT